MVLNSGYNFVLQNSQSDFIRIHFDFLFIITEVSFSFRMCCKKTLTPAKISFQGWFAKIDTLLKFFHFFMKLTEAYSKSSWRSKMVIQNPVEPLNYNSNMKHLNSRLDSNGLWKTIGINLFLWILSLYIFWSFYCYISKTVLYLSQ